MKFIKIGWFVLNVEHVSAFYCASDKNDFSELVIHLNDGEKLFFPSGDATDEILASIAKSLPYPVINIPLP
ncbi:hypothetical protein FM109_05340 [Vibrio casei]|uniref:Uncharacterized protein n=1 Tax=Vibrio casei TaxID=673372 RepID=A0A368LHC4_9VIBR|nr:hypothetical protein CIK83_11805 [Vibrio casei]SJN24266.1 hypothetical protein FM109_05340 [Vibrio casei]